LWRELLTDPMPTEQTAFCGYIGDAAQPIARHAGRVPADLAACHTAEVDGYVLEGHVPALAVRRLLERRPTALGLAVPGLPAGSPGMEGVVPQRYDVVLFGATGREPFMHFVGAKGVD
jgi:hypothetical protein